MRRHAIVPNVVTYSTVINACEKGLHSIFLARDDRVLTAGGNTHGQLTDGTTTERYSPVQVDLTSDVQAISVGFYHSVFLARDGTAAAVTACEEGRGHQRALHLA